MGKIFDRIINALADISCALIALAFLIVCSDVLLRYFLNSPISWSVEITEYIIAATTLLGAAWLLKNEGHVIIDIVLNLFKPGMQIAINIVTSGICALMCLSVSWYGARNSWIHFRQGTLTTESLEWPLAPFLFIVAVSFLLLAIQFARRTYQYWAKRGALLKEKEQRGEFAEHDVS